MKSNKITQRFNLHNNKLINHDILQNYSQFSYEHQYNDKLISQRPTVTLSSKAKPIPSSIQTYNLVHAQNQPSSTLAKALYIRRRQKKNEKSGRFKDWSIQINNQIDYTQKYRYKLKNLPNEKCTTHNILKDGQGYRQPQRMKSLAVNAVQKKDSLLKVKSIRLDMKPEYQKKIDNSQNKQIMRYFRQKKRSISVNGDRRSGSILVVRKINMNGSLSPWQAKDDEFKF